MLFSATKKKHNKNCLHPHPPPPPLLPQSSKVIKRRDHIMRLEPCIVSLSPPPPPPPPTLGAMLATLGQLTEFRVTFNGNRVTLMYGDKRRKRTRGKKPCAPGAVKGVPKPAAQLPAAVPSFNPSPAQPGASREVQGGGGAKPVTKPPGAVPSGNRIPASTAKMAGKGDQH